MAHSLDTPLDITLLRSRSLVRYAKSLVLGFLFSVSSRLVSSLRTLPRPTFVYVS